MGTLKEVVLTIGGWDPCGGAGLAADIKTFEKHQVHGMGICSAITSQSHDRFYGLSWTSPELIQSQLQSILDNYKIGGVKFGVVESPQVAEACINLIATKNPKAVIVWDPVIKASAGFDFNGSCSPESFISVIKKIDLLTPNLSEAMFLFGTTNEHEIQTIIQNKDLSSVLLKGGHATNHADDILISATEIRVIKGEPFGTNPGKHGSGCVYSAAVCSALANGAGLFEACESAKSYTERFILSTDELLGWHFKV